MMGIGSHLNLDYKFWFWFSNGKNSKTVVCFLMYFSFKSYLGINWSSLYILQAG